MKFLTVARTLLLSGAAMLSATMCMTIQSPVLGDDAAGAKDKVRVYIGTYTDGSSEGIYQVELDTKNGTLSEPKLAAEAPSPNFLSIHPNKQFLYAVSHIENAGGQREGAIAAYKIDPQTGNLTEINRQPSGGPGPCHVAVEPNGRYLAVANYSGGSAAILPILEDGSLAPLRNHMQHAGSSVNERRQRGPHAHSATFDSTGSLLVIADLGIDQLVTYKVKSEDGSTNVNTAQRVALKPGAGPRHFAFHPSEKLAFAINELDSTISTMKYNAESQQFEVTSTVSTLPEDFNEENTTAEIVVHPSGKFVYGSNRGHDSIAVFAVDQNTGELVFVQHHSSGGKVPRNFNIDPSGNYLLSANQNTDNVVLLKIDAETGKLSGTGQELKIGKPVCIKFYE